MSSYQTHTGPPSLPSTARPPRAAPASRMAELVARVAASPHAAALHPVTAHYVRRLFAHDTFDFSDDQIQVEHDGEAFAVRYLASGPPRNPQQAPIRSTWHRRDVDGHAALERCLDDLRWIPAVSPPAPRTAG